MRTYRFGLSAILAIALVCVSTHSFAAVLSSWSFEAPNTPSDVTNNGTGPDAASDGGIFSGIVNGLHASADTDWTTPAGNGSVDSYSVNTWAVGDYFQISTSSLGYENLNLSFDATGSGTGPKDFKVQTSSDGVNFADTGFTYEVLINGAPNSAWSAGGSVQAAFNISTLLPASLNNQASIFVRLVQDSTTSINDGTVAAGGTSRIDNVLIEGTAIIPEPSTVALAFLSLGVTLIRRK